MAYNLKIRTMKTKVLIIGAGPSGSACGIRLKKAGIDCILVDKQSFPRQKLCAGLLTHKSQECLKGLLDSNDYEHCMNGSVSSREQQFTLYRTTETPLVSVTPIEPITLVDRERFDQELVNSYVGLGGMFRDSSELTGIDFVGQIAHFRQYDINYEYLIAADGANSTVERLLRKECPDTVAAKRKSSFCLEVNVSSEDYEAKGVNIYFGIVPKSYAWVFSKGKTTCIGLVKLPGEKFDVNAAMKTFLEDLGVKNIDNYPLRGAMLPIGAYMQRPVHWNTMFVGDAAGFVEPLTGEGIYYALQSGIYAAEAIIEKGNTSSHYANKANRLMQLIDKGQKYQSMLESPRLSSLFFGNAHRHPQFIRYFYHTQIEHASLDSFWKTVLKYELQYKRNSRNK